MGTENEIKPAPQVLPEIKKTRGEGHPIAAIHSRWRIDDEWWRETPISRLYYTLLLEDGRLLTLFRDLVTGRWFQQRY